MIRINENYLSLKGRYLFKSIADKVAEFKVKNGDNGLIALGIGDVSLPLAPTVAAAFSAAAKGMGVTEGFHGYAPYFGYDFLREAIASTYSARGADINTDEIFISDGAKCDIANLTDIFGKSDVLIPSPAYPAYIDVNVMCGNTIKRLELSEDDGFVPHPDSGDKNARIIYLCSPNNPTGVVYSASILREWVGYALGTGSLIVFDGAYSEYITTGEPHSIYEIAGAKNCAIEICSLSKCAGFTGVRCGWCVVPKSLKVGGANLNALWQRRQSTKFNGVSYPVQVAAAAALSEQGKKECKKQIDYYLENAKLLCDVCKKCGIICYGGVSSPYVWVKCPKGYTDLTFFDLLLEKARIICTPGSGFGCDGGFIRLTAFNLRSATVTAAKRLEKIFCR